MAKILITGAHGRTGRSVVSAIAQRGGSVRAFLRSEVQWPVLKDLGASDYAIGDLEDSLALQAAVKGCEAVVHIGPPMHPREVEITKSLVKSSLDQGVGHLVYYSVMHTLRREVRHHRLKLDAEEAIVESGMPYTILQPIRYMQHLEPIWAKLLDTGVHAMPFNTKVKFNVVDLKDLAEVTAIVATNPALHTYAIYELAGPEALSQSDMAGIISRILGRPITAMQVSLEDLEAKARKNGADDDRVEQMKVMNQHYDRYGFLGNSNILRWILGREPSGYEDYVRRIAKHGNRA
ncbi:MAG: NmrA family NAD(P)-binding protein [Rhodospirillaceae bacterium]